MNPLRQHTPRLVVAAAILVAALPALRSLRLGAANAFAPYQDSILPQSAQGDFDGDGRVDTAVIQERDGGRRLSIRLSTSGATVDLESTVTGVVEDDIDHDGDVDLIAATSSGELLIWLNDGHGRFTRKPVSSTGALSGEPAMSGATTPDSAAVNSTAMSLPRADASQGDALANRRSPPARSVVQISESVVPPPLRAPPSFSA